MRGSSPRNRSLERGLEILRVFCPGAPVLSLAEAYMVYSEVLPFAVPLMKRVADMLRVNAGLAVSDGEVLVYLHSIRRSFGGMTRHVTTGHRVPVEATVIGRAYLATLSGEELARLLKIVRPRHRRRWRSIEADLRKSIRQVQREGYCQVRWLPGVTAIATPSELPNRPPYMVNITVKRDKCGESRMSNELVPALLRLARNLHQALAGGNA